MRVYDLLKVTFASFSFLLSSSVFSITNEGIPESRADILFELSKPAVRGAIVYKSYCVLCHGEMGDGRARSKKLYKDANLSITEQSSQFFEKIIRLGGASINRSPYMPMFNDELSNEQVGDVVAYLSVVRSDVKRGHAVYKTNCILCHGINGNGKGRAARLFNPPPADLRHSDKNDDYREMIIRLGGEAMGRSPGMPVWGDQLSDQEIKDVINYLNAISGVKVSVSK